MSVRELELGRTAELSRLSLYWVKAPVWLK